ncbi:hypothetical protein, partial [Azotobacter beijerinckii]|uniref:hypothetical protein n=1 Tax=Azotobacter beijerinckii TaxID=170623 RepID=UPI002955AE57
GRTSSHVTSRHLTKRLHWRVLSPNICFATGKQLSVESSVQHHKECAENPVAMHYHTETSA